MLIAKNISKKIAFFAIPIVDFAIADRPAIFSANCDRWSRYDLEKMIADRRSFDRRSLMLWKYVKLEKFYVSLYKNLNLTYVSISFSAPSSFKDKDFQIYDQKLVRNIKSKSFLKLWN